MHRLGLGVRMDSRVGVMEFAWSCMTTVQSWAFFVEASIKHLKSDSSLCWKHTGKMGLETYWKHVYYDHFLFRCNM